MSEDNPVKGESLLLATDGKPHSAKAINYAIDLAKLTSSRLFIVYVVSPRNESEKQALIKEGMEVLQGIKDRAAGEGVDATTMLEAGSPYKTILSAADRVKAGAIIVGTSGKTALDRVLIGSVSEYVVRNAPCSVIVVK